MRDIELHRRAFLSRVSLWLSGLAGAVVSVPIVSYLISPLIRPTPQQWVDVAALAALPTGQTVLQSIADPSPLEWAGQTARTAVWVRREGDSAFSVFAVNCTHLGCPVNWRAEAGIFLCPCHGGVYYADGSVAGGPPPRALFRYQTRVQDGKLQVLSRPLPIG